MLKGKTLVLGLLLGTAACFGQRIHGAGFRMLLKNLLAHSVPEISVADAARDEAQITFLDAREAREFEVSHLPGALHIGYEQFALATLQDLPRDRRLVVYCSVGYRSEKITEQLRAAGFTDVANLYGGLFEWVNQGHPVVSLSGETKRVHAYSPSWGMWLRRGKKVYR